MGLKTGAGRPNPLEEEGYGAQAVFAREDGARTFAIERACAFGVICILMALALFVAVMPSSWFQTDLFAAIDQWSRSHWPKLRYDAGMLDKLSPLLGTKFALFLLFCASVTAAFLVVMVPLTVSAILQSSRRLTYPQSGALWKVPVALIVMIYLTVFETGIFAGDTSVGRMITHSGYLWFWTALLWGALSMTMTGAVIVMAKLWAHGQPENTARCRGPAFPRLRFCTVKPIRWSARRQGRRSSSPPIPAACRS